MKNSTAKSSIDCNAKLSPIATAIPQSPALVDISSLRITTNFGDRMGVKKILINVPVGKPNKSTFFRVRDGQDWEFPAYTFDKKEVNEKYILSPAMAEIVPESVRAVRIYAAVDRRGNPMLIPLPLPGEDGRTNPWHNSLAIAIERAKHKWVRVVANMQAGTNDLLEAQGELDPPEWGEETIDQLVDIAFRGKIISNIDHPIIQELLGRA